MKGLKFSAIINGAILVKNYCSSESCKNDAIISGVLGNLDIAEEKYNAILNFYQHQDQRDNHYPDIPNMERDYLIERLDKIRDFRKEILSRFYGSRNFILKKMEINPDLMIENTEELKAIAGIVAQLKMEANEDYYTINLILK